VITNGRYSHEPHWYYNFLYEEERNRGLDCEEDLAAPGVFEWNLAERKAALVLTTKEYAGANLSVGVKPLELLNERRDREQKRREKFPSRLHAAGDAYVVRRGEGKTIIAGYPWFTDWGRDTFIALRGLCLATGRFDVARDILLAWASVVSEGMLPNRFSDHGEQPEFNAVDASLWYVIAVHEYLEARSSRRKEALTSSRITDHASGATANQSLLTSAATREKMVLAGAVEAILDGYSKGTRYGIRADSD